MAENTNFTDILTIQVDTAKFQQSLNQLKTTYDNFIAGLDESTKKGLGSGLSQGLSASIKELSASTLELRKDLLGVMTQLNTTIEGVFSTLGNKVSSTTKKAKKEVDELTEAQKEALRLANEAALSSGGTRPIAAFKSTPGDRFLQGINIEQEGLVNQAEAARLKAEADVLISRQKEISAAFKERNKEQAQADREALQRERELNKAQIERLRQERKELADKTKQEENYWRSRQKLADQAAKEELRAAKELDKFKKAEQRDREKQAAELKRQQQQQLDGIEKYNAAIERQKQLEVQARLADLKVGGTDTLAARKQILLDRQKEIAAQLQSLKLEQAQANGLLERVKAFRQLSQAQAQYNAVTNQLAAVTAQNDKVSRGFFENMIHGFKNTTSLVIRFYTVFALLQAAIDLIKFTVGAPFEILADGLKYMVGIEEAATDLTGVLAANVEFSKDLAENFKIAASTSKDVVQLLKQRAVASGTPFDSLNSTFKALLQGGAFQAVGTLEELVKLAELFQLSLKAAGAGGLAAQGSVQEIGKLFNGVPADYNKFLALVKVTPAEWQKIVKESKTHRDLLDRLPDSMKNYIDAVKLAEFNQARLTKQFGELIDRIGGVGSQPLFSFITDQLREAVEVLESKFNQIAAFVFNLADSIKFLANQILSAVKSTTGSDGLETWFLYFIKINEYALKIANVFGFIISAQIAKASGDLKGFTEAFENFNREQTNIENNTRRALDQFNTPTVTDSEREQAIKDLEILKKNREFLVKEFNAKGGKNQGPTIFEQYLDQFSKLDKAIADASSIAKIDLLKRRLGAKDNPDLTSDKGDSKASRNNLRELLEEFRLAKEQFNEDAEDIRQDNERIRDNIRQRVTDRLISERDAAKLIQDNIADEINSLDQLRDAVDETASKVGRKIKVQVIDPTVQRQGLITLDKELTAFKKQQSRSDFQLSNQLVTQQRKAGKEQVAVDQETIEQRRRLNEQYIKSTLELQSIAREAGILTEIQYFEAVRALELEQFNIEKDRLRERIALEVAETDDKLKLKNQLVLLEQKITDAQSVASDRRQRLNEQEAQAVRDFTLALKQANIQRQQTLLDVITELRPEAGFNSIIVEGINLRAKELDLLEQNLETQLKIAAAKNAETEETRRLITQLTSLRNERDSLFATELRAIIGGTRRSRANVSVGADETGFFARFLRGVGSSSQFSGEPGSVGAGLRQVGEAELRRRNFAFTQAIAERAAFAGANQGAISAGDQKVLAQLKVFDLEIQRAAASAKDFRVRVLEGQLKPSFQNFKRGVLDNLFGPGTVENYKRAATTQDKLAVASDAAVNALANIGQIVNTIRQGAEQGGILGGVGAGIGALSPLLEKIPFVGKFLPAIGGILSFVGTLFTASAKKIAEDIKRNFQNTIQNYQDGNSSLVETLQLLEQQRLSAITRLSGTKGGKKELDSILPEFDQQLKELRKRQQEIISDFDSSLLVLRQNSDVLSEVNNRWKGINDQVKEYIGAGGDAAKAAEFLSLNLINIRKDAANELASAEQEALQEAIKFNDLLKERQQIIDDFAKKEFEIINERAIERRDSNVVRTGKELDAARKLRDEQLTAIDEEIRLSTQRLDRQRQVFDLASDTASLRRRDEELTLASLDLQIQRLRDLKSLVESISIGPNGAISSLLQPQTSQLNVNITGLTSAQAGVEIADALSQELERRYRVIPVG